MKAIKLWLIASVAVFAGSVAVWAFFIFSGFGFVHMAALYWLGLAGFAGMVVSFAVWLSRKLKHMVPKVIAASVCMLAVLVAGYVVFMLSMLSPSYSVHTSPQGTNRVVVSRTGMFDDTLRAQPMRNRWVYRRTDDVRSVVWAERAQYVVDWPSETRAVIDVYESRQGPQGYIIVEFE